ncbi:prepilin-type N-terminal cleavage/methylation domain-containing protein [Psychromonas sp. KJ10-10]
MKHSGFTIVELMVVLAILAILLSVGPPLSIALLKVAR